METNTSTTPLVSVLMTAYNRDKLISFAIESVLASEYENFELIIVDDGSTDQTIDICYGFAEKDDRIRVYQNAQNLGDYSNRNQAAHYAKGVYLKYVDADDYIYPWALRCMVDMMNKFPDAGWGLCSLDQDVNSPYPFQLLPKQAYEYHYFGRGLFHKAPLSSIIRKEVFNNVGGFKNIRMAGDFEMWHRLAKQHPVVLMPHGMVWYRRHGAQEIKSYMNFIQVYESISRGALLAQDCPLGPDVGRKLVSTIKKNHYKKMLTAAMKLDISGIKESWRRLSVKS